jgi:hypothetical protein
MWRWFIPLAASLLTPLAVLADEIDRFCDYMPRTMGAWANGKWDNFNDPPDTSPKKLVFDSLSHLRLRAGPLRDVTVLRIQEPRPGPPPAQLGQPLLGLINSDQGKKLVIVQYQGGDEYFFRVVNTDEHWSFPDGGTHPLPIK